MKRRHLIVALTGWIALFGVLLEAHRPGASARAASMRPSVAGSGACAADIAPAGGDGTVNVTDLLELLATWGACTECPDASEPNDACVDATPLPTVYSASTACESDEVQWTSSTLSAGELDLYVFTATENDATCSCCDQFCLDEDYLIEVTLAVPVTATGSLVFKIGSACTTSTVGAVEVAPGGSSTLSIWLDGDCTGMPNSYTRHVLVAGADGTVSSCEPYTLTYAMTPGCE